MAVTATRAERQLLATSNQGGEALMRLSVSSRDGRRASKRHHVHNDDVHEEIFSVTSGNLLAGAGGLVLQEGQSQTFEFELLVPPHMPGSVMELCHGHAVRWTVAACAKARSALFSWTSAKEEIPVISTDAVLPQAVQARNTTYDKSTFGLFSKGSIDLDLMGPDRLHLGSTVPLDVYLRMPQFLARRGKTHKLSLRVALVVERHLDPYKSQHVTKIRDELSAVAAEGAALQLVPGQQGQWMWRVLLPVPVDQRATSFSCPMVTQRGCVSVLVSYGSRLLVALEQPVVIAGQLDLMPALVASGPQAMAAALMQAGGYNSGGMRPPAPPRFSSGSGMSYNGVAAASAAASPAAAAAAAAASPTPSAPSYDGTSLYPYPYPSEAPPSYDFAMAGSPPAATKA